MLLLPTRLQESPDVTFQSDALDYHSGAENLLKTGIYSRDGVTLTSEREPGYSGFLMIVYSIFGIGNRTAMYLMQSALYLAVSLFFVWEFMKHTSQKVGIITLLLLITLPAAIHANFWPLRESLTLSLMIFLMTALLRLKRTNAWWPAIAGGIALGLLILTYMPYLFLPIFLLPLLWTWKLSWQKLVVTFAIAGSIVGLWGVRNYLTQGTLAFSGTHRPAVVWYARGEQAEYVRGLEPLRCLIAEYITRDWTNRSHACSFNALMHEKWPGGIFDPATDRQIARESQQKILRHFGNYLWFSVFEILELNLPYVNGWGRIYNVFAVISQLILFIGIVLAIPQIIRRWKELSLFLLIPLYTIAVFILTDATPRYHVPILGCYVVLAALGYSSLSRYKMEDIRQK